MDNTSKDNNSEIIERYVMGDQVALAGRNHAHDVCDTVDILRAPGKRSMMFVFHDYTGTLAQTLDWQALKHIQHTTIPASRPSDKVGLLLEGDINLTMGLKALFKQSARDENRYTVPLVSRAMQDAILRECDDLLVRAGADHLIDNPDAESPSTPVFD